MYLSRLAYRVGNPSLANYGTIFLVILHAYDVKQILEHLTICIVFSIALFISLTYLLAEGVSTGLFLILVGLWSLLVHRTLE